MCGERGFELLSINILMLVGRKKMKFLLKIPEGKNRPFGRRATSVFTKHEAFLGYLSGY
jgi:hypothetical protein